jgi:D-alanyl-D-alanine carboxypeptidase/D-alanyl-D-alanine-endopeptidase (penicillin-binding protein 4)
MRACSLFTMWGLVGVLLGSAAIETADASPDRGTMPVSVQQVLTARRVPAGTYGIYVQEIGASEPLLSVNAGTGFNPASTAKLLTTWLALEELGPTYSWPTEAYLNGTLERGKLRGDLILKGYGDPYFITERLWQFQQQLRMRGLRAIDGDLVIDNSYFVDEHGDPADFDGQGSRVYNVLPDALLVNFQSVQLNLLPDKTQQTVRVVAEPMPANLAIENRLKAGKSDCWASIEAGQSAQSDRLIVTGNYRPNCGEFSVPRAVLTAPTYAYGVFRTLWQDSGGSLTGDLRMQSVAELNNSAGTSLASSAAELRQPFLRVMSPPLTDVITYINKFSNNVMARHLFLTLGAETFEPPATLAKARRAATIALRKNGFEFPELYLDNGSGLSRKDRISAHSMAQVLLAAAQRPWAPEFISSLALPGMDGTMRKRFKTEELAGQAHLKTGTLNGVSAAAGYVHARSGRDFVVVIMLNYPGASYGPGQEAQNALIRWVYEK